MKLLLLGLVGVFAREWKYFNPDSPCYVKSNITYVPHVTEPEPWTYHTAPDSYDIRNIDGISYASTDLNQHIPKYCGSCWCHGAMSSVADRLNLQTKHTRRDYIPSIQVIINCGDAGSCNGGDDGQAYAWVHNNGGVPDITCQQYQAVNMRCSALNTCENCSPGGGCVAVKKYPQITIGQHGSVSQDDRIMSEISARGPVSCGINAEPLEDYTGGILTRYSGGVNHVIQIAGWGTQDGTKYWIGRNSWGTYWGEHGWFRIIRGGSYRPGCHWAVPDVKDAWEE